MKRNKYDFIFLHHSTNADSIKPLLHIEKYLENRKEEILIFIGNEFNNIFSPIGDRRKILKRMNVSYVCSQLMKKQLSFCGLMLQKKSNFISSSIKY